MIRIARFCALQTLILCSTVVLGATPKPALIPSDTTAYTQARFDKARLAFYNRTTVDAYKNVGVRDDKWDIGVVAFLQSVNDSAVGVRGAKDYPQLVQMGKSVVESGCSDPLVLAYYGILLSVSHNQAEAEPVLQRAVQGFEKKAYPKCRAAIVPLYLRNALKGLGKLTPAETQHLYNLTVKWTVASFADGSFKPGEDRLVYGTLLPITGRLDGSTEVAGFFAAIRKAPGNSPWAAKTLEAEYEVELAWKARGNGMANAVTAEGWKGFEEHQAAAAKLLKEAWKLHPEYPEAPSRMIGVTNGGAAEEYGTPLVWFKRATAAQIDFMPAYSSYNWSLRPRWGGSLDELYALGVECLKTGRFDTMIPWQYIQALEARAAPL